MEVLMFSTDDFTPALIALPYIAYTTKTFVNSSRVAQVFASRPRYCRWFPYLCNS